MKAAIAAVILMAAACAENGPNNNGAAQATVPTDGVAADPAADTAAVPAVSCPDFARNAIAASETRTALTQRYGKPNSVQAVAVANRHDPAVTDSLFTVFYTNAVFDYHKPGVGGDLLDHAVIRDNRFLEHAALGMGAPRQRIERTFGRPESSDANSLTYECGGEVNVPLTFRFSGGIVTSVEIDYYVD